MESRRLILEAFENPGRSENTDAVCDKLTLGITTFANSVSGARREFHIRKEIRDQYGFNSALYALSGNVVFADFRAVRDFAAKLNSQVNPLLHPERYVKAGRLNAMGLIDEILHYVSRLYREQTAPDAFTGALAHLEMKLGPAKIDALLKLFTERFPPTVVCQGKMSVAEYLKGSENGEANRVVALEELMLLRLANANPAFEPYKQLFDDGDLASLTVYEAVFKELTGYFAKLPSYGPDGLNLWELLRSPAIAEPYSLTGQLEYLRKRWGLLLGKYLLRLLTSLDVVKEEEKPVFFGPGPSRTYVYAELEHEYERFSPDQDWMPRTILIAKSTLVWLSQLTKKYHCSITRLDEIPDAELDELASRGFTGLWLIGLWERSAASREIKRRCGNPEAAASAYSLHDYDIASELGGWPALEKLRERCAWRGIHLASDMVPNHTGVDSRWVIEHPDRFLQLSHPPFPAYSYNGENLSHRSDVGIYLEDHYYNRTDAAVTFKRVDFNSGETRYIYHGNDGTSMPWNDTAQIDFLNPEAREAVIATIVGVCKQFSIVRFDAAMTLAKKHIQRLWYPEPGHGGDIASRAEHALSREEFDKRIPEEFWREVVDRCAKEAPNTLLLAEAFWMMEGYFVRTLGMHRVYNSAFMNMLKMEENAKYRATIKNTLEFDPEILKRFVNFMNNPDEETAVAQFGKGDKYFGICTLMATMPGLPMFGHGQIEGLEEKYGMEYRRAYREETPDSVLVHRHEREIFPLLKKRYLFSGSEYFALYDLMETGGLVSENVFAYSNRSGEERALVVYNNAFQRTVGWIRLATASATKERAGEKRTVQQTLIQALGFGACADKYFFFHEQRSALWFIRSGAELEQQGLFVALDGYQSQVFMNIHVAEDDANRRFSRLCDELGGRGIPDIQAAVQDIFLKDLYAAFYGIAGQPYFNGLANLVHKGITNQAIAAFFAGLRDSFTQFALVAYDYLDGASGKYDSFAHEAEHLECDAEGLFSDFASRIEHFLRLTAYIADLTDQAANVTLRRLRKELDECPALIAYLGCYFLFVSLRPLIGADATCEDARRLIDHWCLDRKLREQLGEQAISPESGYRFINLLKTAITLLPPLPVKRAVAKTVLKSVPENASITATLTRILANEEVKSFLGVHVFDGVLWFNKDRFNEALPLGAWIALVESYPKDATRHRLKTTGYHIGTPNAPVKTRWLANAVRVGQIYDLFVLGEARSDYHYDRLGEAIIAGATVEPKV